MIGRWGLAVRAAEDPYRSATGRNAQGQVSLAGEEDARQR